MWWVSQFNGEVARFSPDEHEKLGAAYIALFFDPRRPPMASGNAPISRFRRHDGVTDVTDVLFPLLPLRVRKFWHF